LPIGRSHNVVVNEEKNYAVAVGAAPRNSSCAGGLIFINMDNPSKPYSTGCAPQDGYVHDAQCIVYRGPDKKYYGRDICYGYNEDTLTIYDVTNKKGPNAASIISRTPYKGASYTHQGWVLDPNWQTHLLLDDELDEGEIDPNRTNPESPAIDGFPVTYIFDISKLDKPVNTGYYKSTTRSVDHNQFVFNGLAFQSNYQAGLRVLDVSSIPKQPSGKGVTEIAYFDVYPGDDNLPGGGEAQWEFGTWSHYSFPSGWIVINTIDRGAFVVKLTKFKGRGYGKRWVGKIAGS
jgi:choice-of-anchor B domain-containing protein